MNREDVLIHINGMVKTSGLGIDTVAKHMSLSRCALSNKLKGESEFKLSEIYKIMEICNYRGELIIKK